MSKKLFSLIHGEDIHIAPKTKVIPSEAFSTILDSQEMIETTKKDIEKYKEEVAEECKRLKEKSEKEGYEKGYAEWLDKIAQLEEEIKSVRSETEAVILPVALKAAKKIVGRELETSKNTVVDIISNSLKAVSTHKRIKIYVNKKELDQLEKNKEQLKKVFENLEVFSIIPRDDIEPNGCIIETEGGIINAQIENQWMNLENAFQKIIESTAATEKGNQK